MSAQENTECDNNNNRQMFVCQSPHDYPQGADLYSVTTNETADQTLRRVSQFNVFVSELSCAGEVGGPALSIKRSSRLWNHVVNIIDLMPNQIISGQHRDSRRYKQA